MPKFNKENILVEVYNLILDSETTDTERKELVIFKDEVEKGLDFDNALMKLADHSRLIGLDNVSKYRSMSKKVNKFYMKINSVGQFKKNFGIYFPPMF